MNLDKLMEYDFAREFVEGKLSERNFLDKFVEKLIKKRKIDKEKVK